MYYEYREDNKTDNNECASVMCTVYHIIMRGCIMILSTILETHNFTRIHLLASIHSIELIRPTVVLVVRGCLLYSSPILE